MLIVVPPKRVDCFCCASCSDANHCTFQTLFPKTPVKEFDRGVVRRLTAAAEVEHHAVRVRPQIHGRTDELGPVVAIDALRESPLESQTLELRGDVVAAEPVPDVNCEALAREEIDHRQRAKPSPIRQLVGDEVHALRQKHAQSNRHALNFQKPPGVGRGH